jgi:hypothetical protein
MIYLIPALISFALGLLIVKAATKGRLPSTLLSFFLSATIGLGASGLLTFISFILFNQLIAWFVIILNLSLTAALAVFLHRQGRLNILPPIKTWKIDDTIALALLGLITLGMFIFASLYPYGGWDAWGCWNFKARFLFLGENAWTGMFDPILWRHQILYPFLLPLIHVWFWSFGNTPTYAVPMAITCLIPFLTAGLLYSALKELTVENSAHPTEWLQGKWYMILVPVWIFTNMFTIQLSASQYSDLLLGLFLLTAMTLFLLFQRTKDTGHLILMGLVLGMISFTKVEGTALCVLTFISTLALVRTRACISLITATALAVMPVIIFVIAYAPKNSGIFINGLTSPDHPTSWERLSTIMTYYGHEWISMKWSGLWLVLTAGLIFSGKRSLRRELWIIPIVLGSYVLVFTGTYFINTFYEITWWLDTSLNRIIFALIPVTALWTCLSIDDK